MNLLYFCQQNDIPSARSFVDQCDINDLKLVQVSTNDDEVLDLYMGLLYQRFGQRFIMRVIGCEVASPSLLMYTLSRMSLVRGCRVSDQALSVCARRFLTRPHCLVCKSQWDRTRLRMKKDLGGVVQCLWGAGLCSADAILCISKYCSFAFTPSELRTLVIGFVGRQNQEPGYRRVVLHRRGLGVGGANDSLKV